MKQTTENYLVKHIKHDIIKYCQILLHRLMYSSCICFFQNALTLGIILFEIPSLFIGPLIDRFGCRTVKLIAM